MVVRMESSAGAEPAAGIYARPSRRTGCDVCPSRRSRMVQRLKCDCLPIESTTCGFLSERINDSIRTPARLSFWTIRRRRGCKPMPMNRWLFTVDGMRWRANTYRPTEKQTSPGAIWKFISQRSAPSSPRTSRIRYPPGSERYAPILEFRRCALHRAS